MLTADSPILAAPFYSAIENIVSRNVEIINTKIRTEPKRWGVNYVECKLDNVFVINGMDNIDAQHLIYNGIIVDLEQRKFKVKLVIEDETILYVAWKSGNLLDDVVRNIENKVINQSNVEDWLDSI